MMIRHYLKVAVRHVRRHRGYTALNVVGLAVGLACCLLIGLYVQHERSVDRFHRNADRLYRLDKVVTLEEGGAERHAITSGRMGPTLVQEFPEVEAAVRVLPWFDDVLMTRGETTQNVEDVVIADANFFEVFDFRLTRGDSSTVLDAPMSIVLTETTAHRLFGDQDPVGQVVTALGDRDYTVTGVAADVPEASHLTYGALISWASTVPGTGSLSYAWMNNWLTQVNYTYLLLAPEARADALEAKLPAFMQRHFSERADQYALYLQRFTDVYLGSASLLHQRGVRLGNRAYVYVFSAIAALILLIACINFMNLATARAAQRAREVGVRKAVGASRGQLARQFLGESMVTVLGALCVAVALVETARPALSAYTGRALAPAGEGLLLVAAGLLLMLVVGGAAGLYPALVLSGYRPVRVLTGTPRRARGVGLRRALVTVQLVISIALIAGTLVIYQQMRYVQTKNLGFDRDRIVVLPVADTDIPSHYEAFRDELLRSPDVERVTAGSTVPGRGTMGFEIHPEGQQDGTTWLVQTIRVADDDLLATYGMTMAAGRYFSRAYPTDSTRGVVINETLAQRLGWTDPVGKHLEVSGERGDGRVIGVIRDFHYESLHQAVAPLVLFMAPRYGEVSVRLAGADVQRTLAYLRRTWERFEERYPFEYYFLDDAFAELYASERQLLRTLGLFSVLAVGIACLGLFGLAAFTAEQRTKEIGVRKVLGASVAGIIVLLSRDVLRLSVVAFVLAAPLAYVAARQWLADFAYAVDPGLWLFVAAGALVLAVALLTVSGQSVRAALADPVKSLRYE